MSKKRKIKHRQGRAKLPLQPEFTLTKKEDKYYDRIIGIRLFSLLGMFIAFAAMIYSIWSGSKGVWEGVPWQFAIVYPLIVAFLLVMIANRMKAGNAPFDRENLRLHRRLTNQQLFLSALAVSVALFPMLHTAGLTTWVASKVATVLPQLQANIVSYLTVFFVEFILAGVIGNYAYDILKGKIFHRE